ncbi:MAG: YlzJ-like family protein [Symbiobacteriia bacterium]
MILWTPLPLELVTAGLEPAMPAPAEVRVRGRLVQVAPIGPGAGTVVRLISSDPQDYLDPQFQPGANITWDVTADQGAVQDSALPPPAANAGLVWM